MDSLKMFKGYDKVEQHKQDNLENQQQHRKTSKPFVTTISIFIIFFLTLALAFSLITLIHHTNNETNTNSPKPQQQQQQQQTLNSSESIRVTCHVTRFPDSCITAVTSSGENPTNPKSILRLSLRASVDELTKLASSLGAMALKDCKEQIDDSLSRLNDSMSAVTENLTEEKINDIQTWVSAAVTDQQTCIDGLEEVGSVGEVVEKVKSMMKKSSEYVSNSLAIVANMRTLLQQFNMPLH